MKKTLKNSKKKVPTTKIKLDIKYPIYCIGQKYFQQDQQGKLHPTTSQILTTQYGAGVKDYITYCLTYVNEPSHTNYQQIYNDKYNEYTFLLADPSIADLTTQSTAARTNQNKAKQTERKHHGRSLSV